MPYELSHALISDLYYPLVGPWHQCLAVLCKFLRLMKKYKQKAKDVYHFQQAEVICES